MANEKETSEVHAEETNARSGVEDKMIRWEDPKAEVCGERGGEGMFPHLYDCEEGLGLQLGAREVESVAVWEREIGVEDGKRGWAEAVRRAEGWLVY